VNVTAASGIRFLHSFGDDRMSNIIEASGSGCAFFDYNNDGWMDLYAVNGGYLPALNDSAADGRHRGATDHLYRNNQDGTFTDVTEQAGCGDAGYGMACTSGDIDNDGYQDIFVSNYGRSTLYHNQGNGTFADITLAAGTVDTLSGMGCALLDFDDDGFLDLYVGNYLDFDPGYRLYYAADEFPGPLAYPGQRDLLFRNNGDLTFTEVNTSAGVRNDGRAMGVAAADYDNDGWVDLYVANDAMENYLYHNDGDGTFTNVAPRTGVALSANGDASSSMGGDWGDYDNDGDLDLIVPDMAFNNLYENLGNGLFDDVTAAAGIAEVSGQFISWSGHFADFDNDGWLDMLISTGDAHRLDTMEPLLLVNTAGPNGKRVFRDQAGGWGAWFLEKSVARGVAVADYDNDGDLDFFMVNLDRPSELIRNDGGNRNHWLMLDLIGTHSNRDALGARVTVRVGDLRQIREKRSASGYLSQSDPRLHFGLGETMRVDEVEIRWPRGTIQRLTDVQTDRILSVQEPSP
jgi:hypothetical protein